MFSKVARTLVPRSTNFVAKRAFQHETYISGPPRVKISSAEKVWVLLKSDKFAGKFLIFTFYIV